MLSQLRSILGRHLKSHPLLEHSLRREFLARIPLYACDLLTLMDNSNLDQTAAKAHQLVNDRKRHNSSSSRSHFSDNPSNLNVLSSGSASGNSSLVTNIMHTLDAIQTKLNRIVSFPPFAPILPFQFLVSQYPKPSAFPFHANAPQSLQPAPAQVQSFLPLSQQPTYSSLSQSFSSQNIH